MNPKLPAQEMFDHWWDTRCTPAMKAQFDRTGLTKEGCLLIYLAGADDAVQWLYDEMARGMTRMHDAIPLTREEE